MTTLLSKLAVYSSVIRTSVSDRQTTRPCARSVVDRWTLCN